MIFHDIAANIKKIFDKRKRYFSFNESSNHSLDSSEKSYRTFNKTLADKNGKDQTPSFAPNYSMRSFNNHKQKGPFKNQLKQIASKVRDDNFSFRNGSKRGSGKIQMSLYSHKRKPKYSLGVNKKIRKYSGKSLL